MECENCGKENPETTKFCTGCGNPLKRVEENLQTYTPDDSAVTFDNPEYDGDYQDEEYSTQQLGDYYMKTWTGGPYAKREIVGQKAIVKQEIVPKKKNNFFELIIGAAVAVILIVVIVLVAT